MKLRLLLITLLIYSCAFAQIKGDSRITATLADSTSIYEKARISLVRNDFIIKDLPARDTITTYSREYKGMHVALRGVIEGNQITFTGYYSLRQLDMFGYQGASKYRKRIIYYVGALTWNIMLKVARETGPNLSFSE